MRAPVAFCWRHSRRRRPLANSPLPRFRRRFSVACQHLRICRVSACRLAGRRRLSLVVAGRRSPSLAVVGRLGGALGMQTERRTLAKTRKNQAFCSSTEFYPQSLHSGHAPATFSGSSHSSFLQQKPIFQSPPSNRRCGSANNRRDRQAERRMNAKLASFIATNAALNDSATTVVDKTRSANYRVTRADEKQQNACDARRAFSRRQPEILLAAFWR